jgi:hypothetical protein
MLLLCSACWVKLISILVVKIGRTVENYSKRYVLSKFPAAPLKLTVDNCWRFSLFSLVKLNQSVYCLCELVHWLKSYLWGYLLTKKTKAQAYVSYRLHFWNHTYFNVWSLTEYSARTLRVFCSIIRTYFNVWYFIIRVWSSFEKKTNCFPSLKFETLLIIPQFFACWSESIGMLIVKIGQMVETWLKGVFFTKISRLLPWNEIL